LGITAVFYFLIIKHNAKKVSADALYFVRKLIQFLQSSYTAFVGNLFYRLSHSHIKRSHMLFVGKLKNF